MFFPLSWGHVPMWPCNHSGHGINLYNNQIYIIMTRKIKIFPSKGLTNMPGTWDLPVKEDIKLVRLMPS